MAKAKACKKCGMIYQGKDSCPNCGSKDFSENFKGKIAVLDSEKSNIAKKLNIEKQGEFAIKT